jgi:hypothetical protein
MRPGPLAVAVIFALAAAAHAQSDGEADVRTGLAGLKARFSVPGIQAAPPAAAAPAPGQTRLFPRSGVAEYLSQVGDTRAFSPRGSRADDAAKFHDDAALAIRAYERIHGRAVVFADQQKFDSADFFMRTGAAILNPNSAQTAALARALHGLFAGGPILQTDLVYEALVAADGNATMAMGSLAQLFCEDRSSYIPKIADMSDANGKAYYRFTGFFIGLHGAGVRGLGRAGSYANMGGNPVIYAGAEIYSSWKSYFTTGRMTGADTLKTLGPDGHGDLVDKGGELHKGFDAAELLRAEHPKDF